LYWLTAIFGSLAFGTSTSLVFPLLLSLPQEFGVKFKPEQLSNMMFPSFLASMLLTGITGKLMEAGLVNLFIALMLFGLVLFFDSVIFFKLLEKES
jgi:hypothetical protein